MIKSGAVAGWVSAVSFGTSSAICEILTSAEASARAAADARVKIVSSVFARAADRHLYDHGGKWRQDEHKHPADNAETAVAIAASEEHAELRKHRNGASNGSGYRHRQRVVITHMA
jgi:hypothetical protein